jgi:hypothetical protein
MIFFLSSSLSSKTWPEQKKAELVRSVCRHGTGDGGGERNRDD